jgi:hypothetical protein
MAHGGLAYRGTLWFDVSGVPQGSIINHVDLQVNLNRAASKFYFRGVDSLLLQQTTDTLLRSFAPKGVYGLPKGNDLYSFTGVPLMQAVRLWVNRPNLNYGLTLRTVYEGSDLDLYALFGAEADTSKRPRLIVTYSTKP